jgi:hypothetical protein
MTKKASGAFEVTLTPQAPAEGVGDPSVGRLAIDKRFRGDLDATSRGEMLATRTPVDGSAGYVALERVTGSLHGRAGGFSLQHSGTMDRGVPRLSVTVVPGSGTGELAGLAGKMAIRVEGGTHSYEFEYTLPEAG